MTRKDNLFSNMVISGIVFCLALLFFIFGSVFWNYKRSQDSFQLAMHAQEVLNSLSELLSFFQDAEIGQRGFLITGEEEYLQPFNESALKINAGLLKLRNLTSDNSAQQKRLDRLEQLIPKIFDELMETIQLRRNQGLEAALVVVETGKGKQVMDNIRMVVAAMEEEESRLIDERQIRAEEIAELTVNAQYMGIVLILLVGMVAAGKMRKDFKERKEAERKFLNARREDEERAYLMKDVATAANAASNPDEVLHATLKHICEYIQWPVGHVYRRRSPEDPELISTSSWFLSDPGHFQEFKRITETTFFKPGKDLIGRILKTKRPEWVRDISQNSRFARNRQGIDSGLHSGFAFPVLVGGKVMAVLEFYSEKPEAPNRRLLNLVGEIGTQLGFVIERYFAEQALVESERKSKNILDHASAAIYLKDTEGKYLMVNRRFEQLLHTTNEQIRGKTDFDILPEEVAKVFIANDTRVLKEGKAINFEEVLAMEDHTGTYLSVKFPLFNEEGQVQAVCGISTDISDRKTLESKMLKTQKEAQEANLAKSKFLSRMSHELRTPLNAILGFSQLLEQSKRESLSENQRKKVKQIRSSGQHLLELINEVLDLSRIESGELSISPEAVCVQDILDDVVSTMLPIAEMRKVRIAKPKGIGRGLYAQGDKTRLRQVFLNLVSNAIKYNREKGSVTFEVVPGEMHIQIIIKDTGLGIPEGKIPELFQPFNRLNMETSDVEGTGIGLTITQKLLNLMGGRIFVQSTYGEGSRFTIELPKAAFRKLEPKAPESETEPSLNRGDPGKNYIVLYIEDNPTNMELVKNIMNEERPQITLLTAMRFGLGMELAKGHKPHLILLDIHLPETNGFDGIRQIKTDKELKNTPVYALSANVMESEIKKAMRLGFDAYIKKPIDTVEFLKKVDAALEIKVTS